MSKEICKDCGRVIFTERDDFIVTADGDYVCEDCRDNYDYCYECEEYFPTYELRRTEDDYYVCEDCADRFYEECMDCGDLCHRDDMYYVESENAYVCGHCANDYYYCECCGRMVHYTDWNGEFDMCDDCARDYGAGVICGYHDFDGDLIFYDSAMERAGVKPPPQYYMGGEIEWCNKGKISDVEIAKKLTDALGDRAHHERDCTVDVETVLQPHSYEAIIESGEIKRAFDILKEYCVEESERAGLHIHVSRTAFGETQEEQEDNITKLIILHTEGHAYEMLKKLSRRTDHAARWARQFRMGDRKEEKIRCAKNYVKYYDNDHGVAINCGNRDTVEFRLGAGTVDYENFITWIKIIKLIVDRCKTISIEDASNFYMWFADADDSLKAYMEERGVKWEEPISVTVEDCRKIIDSLMDSINGSLTAQNAQTLDYNTMLTVLCNANTQTRVALGYM